MFVISTNEGLHINEIGQASDLRTCICIKKIVKSKEKSTSKYVSCHPFVRCTDFYHELILRNYSDQYFVRPVYGLKYAPVQMNLAPRGLKTDQTFFFSKQPEGSSRREIFGYLAITGFSARKIIDQLPVINNINSSLGTDNIFVESTEEYSGENIYVLQVGNNLLYNPIIFPEYIKFLRVFSIIDVPVTVTNYQQLKQYAKKAMSAYIYKQHFANNALTLDFVLKKQNHLYAAHNIGLKANQGRYVDEMEIHNCGFEGLERYIGRMMTGNDTNLEDAYIVSIASTLRNNLLSAYNLVAVSKEDLEKVYTKGYKEQIDGVFLHSYDVEKDEELVILEYETLKMNPETESIPYQIV